jgi:hypothetical protein
MCKQAALPQAAAPGGDVAAAISRIGQARRNLRRVVWDLLLLARLVSGDLPPSPDEPTKAERKTQEPRS